MTKEESSRLRLDNLIKDKNFDQVLNVLADIERERSLAPFELVLKGRSVQLSSGIGMPPLEEAEIAFRQALEGDEGYIPALLELGWFYHAVENDPPRALPFFERAIELSRQSLVEAISGKADCLAELQTEEAAAKFLRTAIREAVRIEDLSEEQQSWARDQS